MDNDTSFSDFASSEQHPAVASIEAQPSLFDFTASALSHFQPSSIALTPLQPQGLFVSAPHQVTTTSAPLLPTQSSNSWFESTFTSSEVTPQYALTEAKHAPQVSTSSELSAPNTNKLIDASSLLTANAALMAGTSRPGMPDRYDVFHTTPAAGDLSMAAWRSCLEQFVEPPFAIITYLLCRIAVDAKRSLQYISQCVKSDCRDELRSEKKFQSFVHGKFDLLECPRTDNPQASLTSTESGSELHPYAPATSSPAWRKTSMMRGTKR